MTPREFHKEVGNLFNKIRRLPSREQPAALDEACQADTAVGSMVRSLLAQETRDTAEIASPAMENEANQILGGQGNKKGPLAVPCKLGRYEVVRWLGEGGMGVVYEARQTNTGRAVAIKLLRSGFASAELRRRFELEVEVLGQLEHSGIAQIFDADTVSTELGECSFYAMELIRGSSLLQHAENKNLSVKERLGVFAEICDTIHYAHQKGIIHRDIKPANILVAESGQTKIVDFGIARLVGEDAKKHTQHTEAGQIVGTFAYMSPEQASGESKRVDTRSDVYSLGAVLYELLGGRPPVDMDGKDIPGIIQAIREDVPRPLGSLDASLRGDVETITAKSLEKYPERRYQSARELADDVRRYLRGEPIEARRDSTLYTLMKKAEQYLAGCLQE